MFLKNLVVVGTLGIAALSAAVSQAEIAPLRTSLENPIIISAQLRDGSPVVIVNRPLTPSIPGNLSLTYGPIDFEDRFRTRSSPQDGIYEVVFSIRDEKEELLKKSRYSATPLRVKYSETTQEFQLERYLAQVDQMNPEHYSDALLKPIGVWNIQVEVDLEDGIRNYSVRIPIAGLSAQPKVFFDSLEYLKERLPKWLINKRLGRNNSDSGGFQSL